jgi:hypothetical protein
MRAEKRITLSEATLLTWTLLSLSPAERPICCGSTPSGAKSCIASAWEPPGKAADDACEEDETDEPDEAKEEDDDGS